MRKKLKKLCALVLSAVTVLSILPSSGLVNAETDTDITAEESVQSTVYFKVPNPSGQVIVTSNADTDEEVIQTITVDEEKTTLTDNDGNTSDVTLTEEEYCLELTEEVGETINLEFVASEGYEVDTYHIISDAGDENESIEEITLSDDNKYEYTFTEESQVLEVTFNATQTTQSTMEENVVEEQDVSSQEEETVTEVAEPETTTKNQESNNSSNETSNNDVAEEEEVGTSYVGVSEEEVQAYKDGLIKKAEARAYNVFDHIGQTVNVQTWDKSQDTDSYKISWVNSNGVVKHKSQQGRLGVVSKLQQPGIYNDKYLLQIMWCGDTDIPMRTGTRVVRDLSKYSYTGYTQTRLKQAAALFYWWDSHYGDDVSSFQNYYVKQAIVWWIKGSNESGKKGNTPYANWDNTSLRAMQKELWSTGLKWANSNYSYFDVDAVLLTGENQPLFTMNYTYEPTGSGDDSDEASQ